MSTSNLTVLELSGPPYEMGFQHGRAHAEAIGHFARERVRLAGDPQWSGQSLSREDVLALAEACAAEHRRYSPELTAELQGMADGAGLSLAELIVVSGFTDFIDTAYNAAGSERRTPVAAHEGADNCTAFLIPKNRAENAQALYGQTWDMHDSATPHVILISGKSAGKPAFLVFTTAGCVGMIGMNAAGVTLGINNLSAADGQIGVTWNFVVRKALEQTTVKGALACITDAKLAGAHNYLLMDASGAGYNVEATPSRVHITELADEPIVHTNHCLFTETKQVERQRLASAQASSERRLSRGRALLETGALTPADLQAVTRDPEAICVRSAPPRHVETCGAAVMRPATGDFWAVWGLPSENEYEHFRVG